MRFHPTTFIIAINFYFFSMIEQKIINDSVSSCPKLNVKQVYNKIIASKWLHETQFADEK